MVRASCAKDDLLGIYFILISDLRDEIYDRYGTLCK